MKNLMLLFIFLTFSASLLAQKGEHPPKFVKGELYHIAVDDLLLPTTNIFKAMKKHKGKVKAILQSKKAEKRIYKLSEKAITLFKELDPIDIDIKSMGSTCICNVSSDWIPVYITVGCNMFRDPVPNCENCCPAYKEAYADIPWYQIA